MGEKKPLIKHNLPSKTITNSMLTHHTNTSAHTKKQKMDSTINFRMNMMKPSKLMEQTT